MGWGWGVGCRYVNSSLYQIWIADVGDNVPRDEDGLKIYQFQREISDQSGIYLTILMNCEADTELVLKNASMTW